MNSPCYIYKRRVNFADTDASGVSHFSRLLCMVEEAEHHALRECGIEVFSPGCSWPRVHLDINYHTPAALNEELTVMIRPGRVGNSSLEWIFEVRCSDRSVFEGKYIVVRVGKGGEKSHEIPEGERAALALFPAGGRSNAK